MANTSYITVENDRWDSIADKAYGDSTQNQIRVLQDANPYETTKDVFKAGVRLVVPIIENSQDNSIDALLPPWKRTTKTSNSDIRNDLENGSSNPGSFDQSFG